MSSAVPALSELSRRFALRWRGAGAIAAAGLLVVLAGCASPGRVDKAAAAPAAPGWREIWIAAIPPGATVDQVRAALGDPAGVVRDAAGAERWTFPAGRAAWPEVAGAVLRVGLRDGRVTVVEVALPRP